MSVSQKALEAIFSYNSVMKLYYKWLRLPLEKKQDLSDNKPTAIGNDDPKSCWKRLVMKEEQIESRAAKAPEMLSVKL